MNRRDDKAVDTLYSLMERLAENGEAIISAMDKLITLEKSGTLDQLIKLSKILPRLPKMSEDFLDEESAQIAMKNLELLLAFALSVDGNFTKTVEKALEALKECEKFEPAGLLDSLKALRDDDVKKAIGFILTFAKCFGKKI